MYHTALSVYRPAHTHGHSRYPPRELAWERTARRNWTYDKCCDQYNVSTHGSTPRMTNTTVVAEAILVPVATIEYICRPGNWKLEPPNTLKIDGLIGNSATYMAKVLALHDTNGNKLSEGSYVQDKTMITLLDKAIGHRLPPQPNYTAHRYSCNPEAKKVLREFLSRPTGGLCQLYGTKGTGKNSAVNEACRQVGLTGCFPWSLTLKAFEDLTLKMIDCQPCCLLITSANWREISRTVKRKSGPELYVVSLTDGLEPDRSIQSDVTIKFSLPTQQDYAALMPEIADTIDLRGFTLDDIEHLKLLLSNKAADPVEMVKFIRENKSGSGNPVKVTWDQVAGLEDAKAALRVHLARQASAGLLLYGPPGTGKTLLAKALATEAQRSFLAVKGPSILNMYIGESERNIRQLFREAKELQPTILFFDEFDSVGTARGQDGDSGGVSDRIVAQLMVEMDRLHEEQASVFIIASTNRPDLLDQALLRPGRLDHAIMLGCPQTKAERIAIMKASSIGMNVEEGLDWDALPLEDVDLSPADLASACRSAAQLALSRKIHGLEASSGDAEDLQVIVTQEDLGQALHNRR